MSESPHNDSRQYEDEISLYDLYLILVEKKAILISTIIIALLAAPEHEYCIRWCDSMLNIKWPIDVAPKISAKGSEAQELAMAVVFA